MIIEVKRIRQSVTQGEAQVLINGEAILTFGDKIEIVKEGQKYYGEQIGGWASLKPDSSFILGLFYHPYDNLYRHSELAKKAILKADNSEKVINNEEEHND